MTASFAALGAYHIGADVETFLDVFGVPDHVHVENAGFMEALDDVNWGDADSGYEQLGAGVDDDGDEIVKFAFCVVVATGFIVSAWWQSIGGERGAEVWEYVLCFPSTSTHLRDKQIHTEWSVLVVQEAL